MESTRKSTRTKFATSAEVPGADHNGNDMICAWFAPDNVHGNAAISLLVKDDKLS
jgi:hypothetical protein